MSSVGIVPKKLSCDVLLRFEDMVAIVCHWCFGLCSSPDQRKVADEVLIRENPQAKAYVEAENEGMHCKWS